MGFERVLYIRPSRYHVSNNRHCIKGIYFISFGPKAVRLKEKSIASEIIAVSCGPKQCQVMACAFILLVTLRPIHILPTCQNKVITPPPPTGDTAHCSGGGSRQSHPRDGGGGGVRTVATISRGKDHSQAGTAGENRPAHSWEAGGPTHPLSTPPPLVTALFPPPTPPPPNYRPLTTTVHRLVRWSLGY